MFLWGVAMTAQGFIQTYSGLLGMLSAAPCCLGMNLGPAARWFLGMFEAGLFPG